MSSHHNKKTIELHCQQVDNAKLRRLQERYQRDHAKQQHRREMKSLGMAWEIFKAVYIACVLLTLLSAMAWALGEIYVL